VNFVAAGAREQQHHLLSHADQAQLRRFFLSERQPLHRGRKCSVFFPGCDTVGF
jgi:hypothetical protein